MVKENAPELLRRELSSPKWKPQLLAMSGVTDCYQPIERKLQLTRRCLAVLAEFRNPVCIITKNFLVTRDLDLLGELAAHQGRGGASFHKLARLGSGSPTRAASRLPESSTASRRSLIQGRCSSGSAGRTCDSGAQRSRNSLRVGCRQGQRCGLGGDRNPAFAAHCGAGVSGMAGA